MKKSFLKFCLLACILLFSVSCTRPEKLKGNEFLIEGEVSGIEDGAVIFLYRLNDNLMIKGISLITTDTVRDGRFTFKSEAVLNPDYLLISGFPPRNLTVWVAPKAKVKIKGQGKILNLWEVKSSVPNQREENRYREKSRDLIAEEARLDTERNDLWAKMRTASSEDETLAYRKNADSITVIMSSIRYEKELFDYVTIMEQTEISDVWINKMCLIAKSLYDASNSPYVKIEKADEFRQNANELYSRMSEDDKNTPIGNLITSWLSPPALVKIGDDMLDGDFLDVSGNTKRLADYSESGKYLILDFWFRGCVFCIQSLPEMREISEIYRGKLTIISINVDNDDNWKKAMTEHDMPWVNIRDPKTWGGLAADYGIVGAPNYVLISPEGKVVDKWAGFATGYLKEKVGENIKQ